MAHFGERLRAHQRRIREDNEKVVIAPGDRLARGQHRMRGSKSLRLDRDFNIAGDCLGLCNDRLVVRTHNDNGPIRASVHEGTQNMGKHGPAGKFVQHLGTRRAHP